MFDDFQPLFLHRKTRGDLRIRRAGTHIAATTCRVSWRATF